MLNIYLTPDITPYGKIEDMMEIIKVTNEGPIMDTTEKYHMCMVNQNGIQLNGTHTHKIGIQYLILYVNTIKHNIRATYRRDIPHQIIQLEDNCPPHHLRFQ
jgi:hypothetical protein